MPDVLIEIDGIGNNKRAEVIMGPIRRLFCDSDNVRVKAAVESIKKPGKIKILDGADSKILDDVDINSPIIFVYSADPTLGAEIASQIAKEMRERPEEAKEAEIKKIIIWPVRIYDSYECNF